MGKWYTKNGCNGNWTVLNHYSIYCKSKEYSRRSRLIGECRLIRDAWQVDTLFTKICIDTDISQNVTRFLPVRDSMDDCRYDTVYLLEFKINDRYTRNVVIHRIEVYYDGSNWYTDSNTYFNPLSPDRSKYFAYWLNREYINSKFNDVSNEWSISYYGPSSIKIELNGNNVGSIYFYSSDVPIDSVDCYVHVIKSIRPITLRTCERKITLK